jgi:hypothetical protein
MAAREQYFIYLLYLGLFKGYPIGGVYLGNEQRNFAVIIILVKEPV